MSSCFYSNQIEDAFKREHQELLEAHRKEIDALMEERRQMETKLVEERMEREKSYQEEVSLNGTNHSLQLVVITSDNCYSLMICKVATPKTTIN